MADASIAKWRNTAACRHGRDTCFVSFVPLVFKEFTVAHYGGATIVNTKETKGTKLPAIGVILSSGEVIGETFGDRYLFER